MRLAALGSMLLLGAGPAAAQTMLDQEQRLIDIHSLLLALPPVDGPGVWEAGDVSLGLEAVVIPPIDGTTGTKRQITASDRTPVYPRPRVSFGLPAPEGWRAFAGLSYIPPFTINEVSTHYGALEAGFAYVPGPWHVGIRGFAAVSQSEAPVTDPNTRDTLRSVEAGGDLSGGVRFQLGPAAVLPYLGVGVVWLDGHFEVTSDHVVLTSQYTGVELLAGMRVLLGRHWEAVAELDAFPGRLVHPSFRFAYAWSL